MSGLVMLHELFHLVMQDAFIIRALHIYEVDDDDTTEVTKAHLAAYLLSSFDIDLEGVDLLTALEAHAVAGVDIYDVAGFGLLDDDIDTVACIDLFAKGGLDLFCDAEIVKYRRLAGVCRDDVFLVRGYALDV